MDQHNKNTGICQNCIHANECKKTDTTVWFCEMFEISDEVKIKPGTEIKKTENDTEYVNNLDEKYKGLCINCNHRKTCKYAKSEGGIWHCEHYE